VNALIAYDLKGVKTKGTRGHSGIDTIVSYDSPPHHDLSALLTKTPKVHDQYGSEKKQTHGPSPAQKKDHTYTGMLLADTLNGSISSAKWRTTMSQAANHERQSPSTQTGALSRDTLPVNALIAYDLKGVKAKGTRGYSGSNTIASYDSPPYHELSAPLAKIPKMYDQYGSERKQSHGPSPAQKENHIYTGILLADTLNGPTFFAKWMPTTSPAVNHERQPPSTQTGNLSRDTLPVNALIAYDLKGVKAKGTRGYSGTDTIASYDSPPYHDLCAAFAENTKVYDQYGSEKKQTHGAPPAQKEDHTYAGIPHADTLNGSTSSVKWMTTTSQAVNHERQSPSTQTEDLSRGTLSVNALIAYDLKGVKAKETRGHSGIDTMASYDSPPYYDLSAPLAKIRKMDDQHGSEKKRIHGPSPAQKEDHTYIGILLVDTLNGSIPFAKERTTTSPAINHERQPPSTQTGNLSRGTLSVNALIAYDLKGVKAKGTRGHPGNDTMASHDSPRYDLSTLLTKITKVYDQYGSERKQTHGSPPAQKEDHNYTGILPADTLNGWISFAKLTTTTSPAVNHERQSPSTQTGNLSRDTLSVNALIAYRTTCARNNSTPPTNTTLCDLSRLHPR
jgi:hypothetical protein